MKNFFDGKFLVILLMIGVGFMACGGDANDDQSEIIDGVNVSKGKKLTEVRMYKEDNGTSKLAYIYKVEYDSKKRLSRIVEINYDKKEAFELLKIDYDLREIHWVRRNKEEQKYMFMLNSNGFVSQMDNCSCEYNNEGYLIGGYNNRRILQIGYDEGEIIQSAIQQLSYDNITTNYYNYDNDPDSGVLIITINVENSKYKGYYNDYTNFNTEKDFLIPCLIAYQVGLFGKTDIHVNSLAKSSMSQVIVKEISSSSVLTIECELMFDNYSTAIVENVDTSDNKQENVEPAYSCYFAYQNANFLDETLAASMNRLSRGVFCQISESESGGATYLNFSNNQGQFSQKKESAFEQRTEYIIGINNGIIVGYQTKSEYPNGGFIAYDLQCPNCVRKHNSNTTPQYRLMMQSSGIAFCSFCKKKYDMNYKGIIQNGEEDDVNLISYVAITTGPMGYLLVHNK